MSSSHPRNPPPLPFEELAAFTEQLEADAWESSTKSGYRTALRSWDAFCDLYHQSHHPTPASLSSYIAYAIRRIASIDTYLSGIAHFMKRIYNDWEAVRFHPKVVSVLRGAHKWRAHRIRRRNPLHLHHVGHFVKIACQRNASYDQILFAAMLVCGFFAMHRAAELVAPPLSDKAWAKKIIKRDTVTASESTFGYYLPYHKAKNLYQGDSVVIEASSCDQLPMIELLQTYLAKRDAKQTSPFLFVKEDGSLPKYAWFVSTLQSYDNNNIGGQSLRAGGATYYCRLGLPSSIIRKLGRWASDAFDIYIRSHPSVLLAQFLAQKKPVDRLSLHPPSPQSL